MRRSGESPAANAGAFEPAEAGGRPCAFWRVRLVRDELTDIHTIQIRIFRRDGSREVISFPAADRAAPRKLLVLLNAHNARLPNNGTSALRFAEDLIRATPSCANFRTARTGWRDGAHGLVMPNGSYGTARGTTWDDEHTDRTFGERRGSLTAYRQGVLIPAQQSTYLTVAVLIGLAAPLLGYVEGRLRRRLLPETALFHWAAETSSGKSTLARVTQSVVGPPGELSDYRASERGIAEASYARNDLVVVFDEAEHGDNDAQAFGMMKRICQCVTAGRSRPISRAVKGSLPSLRWTCFGVSTGPITQAQLSQSLDKLRHGQLARFIDISVPSYRLGGIIDALANRERRRLISSVSARIVKRIESAIEANHGVLFDSWIRYLLSHDVAERVKELTDRFAAELSGGEGGLVGRVARKFAVLYAAGVIGIEADLLPWSHEWLRHAIRRIYQNACQNRDADAAEVNRVVSTLYDWRSDRMRFPRVEVTSRGVPEFDLSDRAVGFVERRGRRARVRLIPDRLGLLGVVNDGLRQRIARELAGDGSESPSRQYRIRDAQSQSRKIRAWPVDYPSLTNILKRGRAASGA